MSTFHHDDKYLLAARHLFAHILEVACPAGISFAFMDGSLRTFQTVATKHDKKGLSTMPPTRDHLYD